MPKCELCKSDLAPSSSMSGHQKMLSWISAFVSAFLITLCLFVYKGSVSSDNATRAAAEEHEKSYRMCMQYSDPAACGGALQTVRCLTPVKKETHSAD